MFPFRVSHPKGSVQKIYFSLGWPSLIPRLSPFSLFHLQCFYALAGGETGLVWLHVDTDDAFSVHGVHVYYASQNERKKP